MKKILIIGMVDSVHLSRWIAQFEGEKIQFMIFPSRKFRNVNPELIELRSKSNNIEFTQKRFLIFYGYKEYIFTKFLSKVSKRFSSGSRLAKIILNKRFDYIHVLEIQGAGYLLLDSGVNLDKVSAKLIITNWGSDIFYFKDFPQDEVKIKKLLETANFYSAECQRDYDLASFYGFTGNFLPLNPNVGGFKSEIFKMNIKHSDERSLIIAKCYGGTFGLGGEIIEAFKIFLSSNKNLNVFFYSVTPDLESKAKKISEAYPDRVEFSTTKKRLSMINMNQKFAEAKIYVGASRSDGICTSFLEALALGAYPIQTNTSCAIEWINIGFQGIIIEPTRQSILNGLFKAMNMLDLDSIRISNKKLAQEMLSFDSISQDSLKIYGL
jgi:glycosyltransferase involved in cell wall biosynthesis